MTHPPHTLRTLSSLVAVACGALALTAPAEASVLPTVASDTLTVTGDGADDQITLRLAAGVPSVVEVHSGTSVASFDRGSFARIAVRSGAGADTIRIDESNGAFTDSETTTLESGAGADVVAGGRGMETIAAGDGADLVHSGGGDDLVLLGLGDDTLVQGAGDGFDRLDGQDGVDTLRVDGSFESEELTVQALAGRVLVSRDTGDAGMDMDGVEMAEINARGGADLIDLGDLAATDLDRLDADLGLVDGAADTVAAAGTGSMDIADVVASADGAEVRGLPYDLLVGNIGGTQDRLALHGGAGPDLLEAAVSVVGIIDVALDGGEGADILSGHARVIRGSGGNDFVSPGKHAAILELGDGDDTATWSPGRADKTIEGGLGADTLSASGSSGDDLADVSPSGARVRLTHNQAERLDAGAVETVHLATGAGTDRVVTNDLAGTSANTLSIDLGGADLKSDTLLVNGTTGADELRVASVVTTTNTSHTIGGQGATLRVLRTESGDRLELNGHGGDDLIDAFEMSKDKLQPFVDGGPGADTLRGSPGQDVLTGGFGNDLAFMGGGIDTFKWAPGAGNDIVEGQSGTDFLRMDGSGADERFDVSAAGSRIRLTRDVSGVSLDLAGVERYDVMPAGGKDVMHVHDVSGTDADVLSWELAPFRGTTASDKQPDRVVVDGTFGADAVNVTSAGQEVRVTGLATTVSTTRSDPTLDTLHVDTKAGSDTVTAAAGVHSLIGFTFE